MKRQSTLVLVAIVMALCSCSTNLQAQPPVRSTGIGVRGSYWKMNDSPAQIIATDYANYHAVDIGNAGGWIFFLSRMSDQSFFEFSLGGVGSVRSESHSIFGEDVEVTAVTPLLMGFRLNLFPMYSESALQPYLAFGGGPYWLHDINVTERFDHDEAVVKSRVKGGAYAGGGMNFMMNSWLGVNFDVKYHFVDFNVNHDYSGVEYGLGLVLMWGNYDTHRRR